MFIRLPRQPIQRGVTSGSCTISTMIWGRVSWTPSVFKSAALVSLLFHCRSRRLISPRAACSRSLFTYDNRLKLLLLLAFVCIFPCSKLAFGPWHVAVIGQLNSTTLILVPFFSGSAPSVSHVLLCFRWDANSSLRQHHAVVHLYVLLTCHSLSPAISR